MVLNSESFKSSDLMYLEYADRIVKSLDQDDDWNVWFEFYFGDQYDVVINLQEKRSVLLIVISKWHICIRKKILKIQE